MHVKNRGSSHTFIFDNLLDLINWGKRKPLVMYIQRLECTPVTVTTASVQSVHVYGVGAR